MPSAGNGTVPTATCERPFTGIAAAHSLNAVGRADDAAVDEGVDRGGGFRRATDERVVLEVAVLVVVGLHGRPSPGDGARDDVEESLRDPGLGRGAGRALLLEVLPRAGPRIYGTRTCVAAAVAAQQPLNRSTRFSMAQRASAAASQAALGAPASSTPPLL